MNTKQKIINHYKEMKQDLKEGIIPDTTLYLPEFDGYVRFDLILKPYKGFEISRCVKLDIPPFEDDIPDRIYEQYHITDIFGFIRLIF